MKPIMGYEGYAVTKAGCVWSEKTKKFLKPGLNTGGYPYVNLCKNGKAKSHMIHRLVLEAYAGPCPEGMECRHLNGNPADSKLENLKWGTHGENTLDAVKHRKHNTLKLTESKARLIRLLYAAKWLKFTYRELGKLFVVTPENIYRITNKQTWKHI